MAKNYATIRCRRIFSDVFIFSMNFPGDPERSRVTFDMENSTFPLNTVAVTFYVAFFRKMTKGTPEVSSDKNLILLTFDS